MNEEKREGKHVQSRQPGAYEGSGRQRRRQAARYQMSAAAVPLLPPSIKHSLWLVQPMSVKCRGVLDRIES